tara:strand:+ start:579 stop:863 length:285 start_codon:yes stop_codon:yes gene_type:complete
MTSTNAIEKALQQKIAEEIRSEVKAFVSNIEQKFRKPYNNCSFYDISKTNSDDRAFYIQFHEMENLLCRMLHSGHADAMLRKKSQELLNKLELI